MFAGKVVATLGGLLLAVQAMASEPTSSPLPLFSSQEVLNIAIEGPLKTLKRERSDTEEYEGVLRFTDADGQEKRLDLRFRARGNFRRDKETCRFPPVRLNLRKGQVKGTLFEGQNILKLVTHCKGNPKYEQYVLKEELAYRIFNLHTPVSFRSRLLRVKWVDYESKNKIEERYGFLIEHKHEMEQRLGMVEAGIASAAYEQLNPEHSATAAVFEYLIGNTDFSMVAGPEGEDCCHNGILLRAASDELFFVPYDFDMAGIVSAPHSKPNPRFKIRSVTTRLYRGKCIFNPLLQQTIASFLNKKNDVMALLEAQPGLQDSRRKKLRGFLDEFYDDLSRPEGVTELLTNQCF